VYWVFASSAAAIAMLIAYLIVVSIAFKSTEPAQLSKEQLGVQLALLGRIKKREWAAIVGILVFAVGVVTTSIHNVQPPWMGMAILYGLLLFGFLNKTEFREKTDWPSLVYLGCLIGMLNVFGYFGLDKSIGLHLAAVGEVMKTNFQLFVAILFGVVLVMRLAIPNTATIALCATIFMPIAAQVGINPWVIGFMLLLLGDLWLLPYQCPHYQQFQAIVRDKGVYDEKAFLKFNLFMNLVRLGGIYVSIPFWTALGLL
jgi:divalent anion:Na+ symporter, DASS family